MTRPSNPRRSPGPIRTPEPLGTPVRRAALRLLDAVLRRSEPLEAALPAATRALHGGPDRGLAHAIAAETLRWLPALDALIDGATRQRLPDDAKPRMALRIALAQALRLGTPPHAAIATVLPLVDGGPRRLVHGVFGTLMRGSQTLPPVSRLPEAIETRWAERWGNEVVEAARAAIAVPPPLDLTLARPTETAAWAERLGGVSLAPGHVRLDAPGAVAELPGYAEGAWWVQDLAASVPARLIGAGLIGTDRGRALDLCAAPGGKTLQLAAAGWQVTALDVSPTRLDRLRENLARTRLGAEVIAADALDWTPEAAFDAVLLDAPCSATGIFRRHPDVLYRAHPALIEEMTALQQRLFARAAAWVKPGGVLVYATCSLEPAEGEAQLARFLATRPDFAVDRAPDILPGAGRDGVIRTLPVMFANQGRLDGFFTVRLRRSG